MDFIYARQSIDKADSISIESQIEFCAKECINKDYKVFADKGYSGKNTDRPEFQKMIDALRSGGASRVIVYRLDRISRSVLDFAELISEFQKINVEFVSVTERFDTSSPIGKAMLMIVMVFAQLERETIQQRIADSYKSRSNKGFYMGGAIPLGLRLKETNIDGVKTSMYEANPDEIEAVKLIYQMYSQPNGTVGGISRYLHQHNITTSSGKLINRGRVRSTLLNPIYVRANIDVYNFFSDYGAHIVNDVSQFVGSNGIYLYTGDSKNKKRPTSISGCNVVLAPHEGWIDANTWLLCRNKLFKGRSNARPNTLKNTWLAGKIKCGECGYALTYKKDRRASGKVDNYYICRHASSTGACKGVGAIRAEMLEDVVFEAIKEKLTEFQALKPTHISETPVEVTQIKIRISHIDEEIEKLIDKVAMANESVISHINKRVAELDSEKEKCLERLSSLTVANTQRRNVCELINYMDKWNELNLSDKLLLVDAVIERINATKTSVDIVWKI